MQTVDDVQDDLLDIFSKLEEFSDHLDDVHGMEMFYGDSNLQDLINHSRQLMNEIVDVEEKYVSHEDAQEGAAEYDSEDDSEETTEEEEE
jgi:hypothetical protein